MKTFISFSGGVESTTMCLLYGRGATALWCDTGWEHDAMYNRINLVEEQLKNFHGGDFELIRIMPQVKFKGEEIEGLDNYIRAKKFMPSKQIRYCTKLFKIDPIDDLLKSAGECQLFIGFNADEEGRTGNLEKLTNVNYRYPLIEDGYTREMCLDLLNLHGLAPNFPIYMKRGGCVGCIFKSVAEFKAMYLFSREEFERTKILEESIQDERERFFAISLSRFPMSVIAAEVEREKELWGEDSVKAMYQNVKPGQSCGAFCHR